MEKSAPGPDKPSEQPTVATYPRPISPATRTETPPLSEPSGELPVVTEGPIDDQARYRAGELLGEGGMGSVRLFEDLRVGREIALKRMRQSGRDDDLRARFLREAQVQGQLEHPSIVPLYDLGTTVDGEPYFTMRRVQGVTLAEVLEQLRRDEDDARARWTPRRLLTAFVSVCLTVHYAHTKGVLHRDLKPGNIMLGEFGEVYVLDWGLARRIDRAATSVRAPAPPPASGDTSDRRALTQEGSVLGTPPYMAPEQLLAEPDLDERVDVYALGLILHELFAWKPFHIGRTFHQIAMLAVAGIDARPSLVRPDTPPEIDVICEQATRAERDARLPTALSLANAVEKFLDGVRDGERRRELSTRAADAAAETLARAEREADDQSREAGRALAMREVVGALALDAEEPRARQLMIRLLTDVPRTPPPAVKRELEEAEHGARQRGLRLASWVWMTWLLTAPAVYWLGIRDMTAFACECGLVAIGTALCFDMARRPRITRAHALVMALVTAAVLSALSMWLGPFVLVPSATGAVLMLLCSHSRARERGPLLAIAALVVLAPLLLEWTGLIPPSYAFEPGRMCLLARAVDLAPRATLSMLVWSTLGFVLVPAIMLTRLRDQLDAAQAKLAMQSWQLRELGKGKVDSVG